VRDAGAVLSRPATLLVSVALLLAGACGAGTAGGFARRDIPDAVLARKAVAYSGYRTGQSPDLGKYPAETEIKQDLELLLRGGWGFIRLFDSGPHAERVLKVIADNRLDLKVMLGVWISGARAKHDAENQDQIRRGVALAHQYADVVAAISVGNENLDDWSNVRVAPAELAAYITDVRRQVEQPVTTDDSWLPFILGQDGETSYADVIEVAKAVDFLSIHVYAFADAYYESWEWKQQAVPAAQRAAAMMAAAIAYTKDSVRQVRATMAAHGLDLPIVVGEVGWKSTTQFTPTDPIAERAIEVYLAHPVNQKMLHDAVMAWVYGDGRDDDSPDAAFVFEAFDEPWKGEWGDDNWGLFDVNRVPKYLVWDLYPDLKPTDAPAYTEADAVCYQPPRPVPAVAPPPTSSP